MDKITLAEYAKMTNQSIRSAVDTVRQLDAVVLENSFVYVNLDIVREHTDLATNKNS